MSRSFRDMTCFAVGAFTIMGIESALWGRPLHATALAVIVVLFCARLWRTREAK